MVRYNTWNIPLDELQNRYLGVHGTWLCVPISWSFYGTYRILIFVYFLVYRTIKIIDKSYAETLITRSFLMEQISYTFINAASKTGRHERNWMKNKSQYETNCNITEHVLRTLLQIVWKSTTTRRYLLSLQISRL